MDFKSYLKNELDVRIARNPKYSLRAFAKQLQIEPSSLSKLLRGERKFSEQMVIRLCDALNLPDTQIKIFLDMPQIDHSIPINQVEREYTFVHLEVETGVWFHFAILELMNLTFFKHDIYWIAKTLDISSDQTEIALKRLQMVNLLKFENGTFTKTAPPEHGECFVSKRDPRGMAQLILKAEESLEGTDKRDRIISGNICCIDTSRLEEARNKIREFRREMSMFLSEGNKDAVYHLGIQLYPLSNKEVN